MVIETGNIEMITKIYKAIDAIDGEMSFFAVNDYGVVVASVSACDDMWSYFEEYCEMDLYIYSDHERFNDAIDPILIRYIINDG